MNSDLTSGQAALGGVGSLAMLIIVAAAFFLFVATLIMPIVVLLINDKLRKLVEIHKLLLQWEEWKANRTTASGATAPVRPAVRPVGRAPQGGE